MDSALGVLVVAKKCMYYLKGDACKCGCTDVPVRLECIRCEKEPLHCNCVIVQGDVWFRVIRKDGSVVDDL